MKKTIVISGFPGVGKSELVKNNKELTILDSDSSKFSWESEGVRHPDFPNNYMEHIENNIGKVDIILVSSHAAVRQAMHDRGITFKMVYPEPYLREEYMERYRNRGNKESFIEMMNTNWNDFMGEMFHENEENNVECFLVGNDTYLSDIIDYIVKHN